MSRISHVVLQNASITVTLPVTNKTESDRYALTAADGLGPPAIDVIVGESVYRGGIFQGSSPQDREIVLLVRINPLYDAAAPISVDVLRTALYQLMSGPNPVNISIYNELEPGASPYIPSVVTTKGYISKVEISVFAKDPAAQITIRCPSSFLMGDKIDNVLPVPPGTPMAVSVNFPYYGSAAAGLAYKFTVKAATSKVLLTSQIPGGTVDTLTINGSRVIGDILTIDTNPENRKVLWTDTGNTTRDITGMCTVVSDRWPSARPGNNTVWVRDAGNLPLSIAPTSFSYVNRYWGI